jgi:hypothetical protein
MIEKSLILSATATADALARLRFYLPYVCNQVLDLTIISKTEIRYTCKDADNVPHIESIAQALLDDSTDSEFLDSLQMRPVFDNRTAPCLCKHDLLPELLEGDHLIAFGPGQYGMGHLFLKTFKYFERECYRMALKQSPEEFVYPNLIPRKLMQYPDYGTDQNATWFVPGTQSPEHLGKPAVCLHCYPHFSKRTLPGDTTITTQGRCYRYEGSDRFSPDRLWEFIMRETVYMGTPVFVRNSLMEIETLTVEWMQSLGLRAWVQEADDPLFDSTFTAWSKVPLKWELRIALPASGTSLAATSFNYHADRYSRPFEISEGGNTAATGCAGFGIERLTWGFLAQNGLDTKRWPESVRKEI